MLVLVSYDIQDDGDRTKVHKVLQGHGERVQYSVFECWLEAEDLERLKRRLAAHVTNTFDSVRFYRLCGACAKTIEVLGWGEPPQEEANWVV